MASCYLPSMEQSLPLFQVIDGRDTFCAVKVFDCIWCSAELVSDVLVRQSMLPSGIVFCINMEI